MSSCKHQPERGLARQEDLSRQGPQLIPAARQVVAFVTVELHIGWLALAVVRCRDGLSLYVSTLGPTARVVGDVARAAADLQQLFIVRGSVVDGAAGPSVTSAVGYRS